ncbi:hypothetical protein C2L65_42785 [Paraburkholderia terrae]|jgi:hypothetical protein|uniref:Uncharacterized protein n=1 Tax=Paraburkholderia terrae TaxID=311230 RepID=A0A2I8F580_9BURK|nr:hypothetical protein [Paraburkholderia terrae]AUT66822.1 hypothetical protein C2L65_42785 [Paraburkholderia terrae]
MGIASERSLRSLVEKWLRPTSATPVRVTRFGHAQSNQGPYVHIELLLPTGPVGLFFFRHRDGAWCVFPPEAERLTMRLN